MDTQELVRKIKKLRELAGPEFLGIFFAKRLLEECQGDVDMAFKLAKKRQMTQPLDWQI